MKNRMSNFRIVSTERKFAAQAADHDGKIAGLDDRSVVGADERKIVAAEFECKCFALSGLEINLCKTQTRFPAGVDVATSSRT